MEMEIVDDMSDMWKRRYEHIAQWEVRGVFSPARRYQQG